MINPEVKIIDSILEVKALGGVQDVSGDFGCISTKSIAELLDGKKEEDQNSTEKEEENKE